MVEVDFKPTAFAFGRDVGLGLAGCLCTTSAAPDDATSRAGFSSSSSSSFYGSCTAKEDKTYQEFLAFKWIWFCPSVCPITVVEQPFFRLSVERSVLYFMIARRIYFVHLWIAHAFWRKLTKLL